MSLKNAGGFVARIQYRYVDERGERHLSEASKDITLGVTKTLSPDEFGVPCDALIAMHVLVVLGVDNEATQEFIFDPKSPLCAHYIISGTTLSNDLGLIDVS